MRKIFLMILCLSVLAIGATAFAEEPTWYETKSFIDDKIERYTDPGWFNSEAKLETAGFETWEEDWNYRLFPNRGIKAGDITINFSWGSSYRWGEVYLIITDFGNMKIYKEGSKHDPRITIKDPQDLTTIKRYIRKTVKYTVQSSKYDTNIDRSPTNEISLYFTDKTIRDRTLNALKHLQKLHNEKYPKERKKEAF